MASVLLLLRYDDELGAAKLGEDTSASKERIVAM